MLFNSFAFLFGFLPVVFAAFFLIARASQRFAAAWLLLASLVFYGWWNPLHVWILVGSFVANYLIGIGLARTRAAGGRAATAMFTVGVALNLLLLGYYKYAGFLAINLNSLFGTEWTVVSTALPLGISFFTFTQIAFLVDVWRGSVREYDFIHYGLFVTYFPHLIAGPVLHHGEMMPQFERPQTYRLDYERVARGVTLLAIGLFKKVILADGIQAYVGTAFDLGTKTPDLIGAWGGVLAYTLQIYFDFSGYSDMAVGLSLMFGVQLPLNFNSPYQASNIIEFWRRWHMTLSRFLRDYLYFPLGGNRHGSARRHLNLMATMVLGGLWHGAGWTFVIWGGLHGIYLVANHGWRALREGVLTARPPGLVSTVAGQALTFLAVAVAWVFFRAKSVPEAVGILKGLVMLNGLVVPSRPAVPAFGVQILWIGGLLALAWFMPNSQTIVGVTPESERSGEPRPGVSNSWPLRWSPSPTWALTVAVLTATALFQLNRRSVFIYFQF